MNESPAKPTPEFVRWTLARRCALRDTADFQDPERAERQVRPLRVYCEAASEGRMLDGICVEATPSTDVAPKLGFRAADVLDAYGGQDFVASQCQACPANAVRPMDEGSLAGCFGLFELSAVEDELHHYVEKSVHELSLVAEFDAHFLRTNPRWYGLWIASPLSPIQIGLHLQLATQLITKHPAFAKSLSEWITALKACLVSNLPLHAGLYPRGEIQANRWIVAEHCPRCNVARPFAATVCAVCGEDAKSLPSRRRHLKGQRPYWPLKGFMNEAALADFLQRYEKSRQTK